MSLMCPDCKLLTMVRVTIDENFEFNTGRGVITVHAEKVPADRCSRCKLLMSAGPAAAAKRSDATVKALVAFIATKIPPDECPGHGQGGTKEKCCERAGEYDGYGSDGPLKFECPKGCCCHD